MPPAAITHVGYIGLGIMGAAMAGNLLKAGFQVTVWNRSPHKCAPLAQQGAQVAASPAELAARRPQVICINVTDTPDVEEVVWGADGIASAAAPGLVIIDHSTIDPLATQQLAAQLAQQQVHWLDAPVSGGDVGARQGTLAIMVGGDAAVFQRVMPVLQAVGKTITHLGPAGMGQVCKACNQAVVVNALMGVCEALELARRSGLDREKMLAVVGAGAGASWQLANLGPRILAGDMRPGFMIDLVLKDLHLVTQTAHALGLELHGVQAAQRYFQRAQQLGHGVDGTQALSKALE